jgi:hypothetical protein
MAMTRDDIIAGLPYFTKEVYNQEGFHPAVDRQSLNGQDERMHLQQNTWRPAWFSLSLLYNLTGAVLRVNWGQIKW